MAMCMHRYRDTCVPLSHTVAAVRCCTMKLHVHVLLSTPPTSQIALVMGNGLLNEVLEANLIDTKPAPDSPT